LFGFVKKSSEKSSGRDKLIHHGGTEKTRIANKVRGRIMSAGTVKVAPLAAFPWFCLLRVLRGESWIF
jgi:hypothetical protein